MQSKFGLLLACKYKQRHATSNKCRAKQRNPISERQRGQQKLPREQSSCSDSKKNGATASGQDTEKVSETTSAKQMREERLKKFNAEFKTKMRLEQARFERRKLEKEMQIREPKTKHQLPEEESEL